MVISGKIRSLKDKINIKMTIAIAAAALLVIGTGVSFAVKKLVKKEDDTNKTVAMVTRGTIVKTLEGSGTLEAYDQYEVTSLVSGDVSRDYFEEGDYVTKNQVLYTIDASSVINNIAKAQNSLSQSKMSYNEAVENLGDLTLTAPCSGTVVEVYINNGDEIKAGQNICKISDNSVMTLDIAFLSSQADTISVGQSAAVEITGGGGSYSGTVKSKASGTLTNSLGVPVVNVEISVQNPGGIEDGDTATAVIGNIACAEPGVFKNSDDTTVVSKASGTAEGFYLIKGDHVSKGQKILNLLNASVSNQVKKSELSVNDSKLSLENLYDDLDRYSIKSPISGKVIQKSVKAGDKISSQQGSTSMAVIADLSAFKLEMSIDELDILSVKVGQTVEIRADALEDKVFYGVVNNVSVVGTSENGVTTYPVEVLISNVENTELIPGLNVTATIVVEKKEDVLMVPAAAINRGNTVVKFGSEETAEVKTGLSDGQNIEITQGLKEGDQVIISEVPVGNSSNSMFENMREARGSGGMYGEPAGGGMGGGMPSGSMNNRPSGGGGMSR